MDFSEIPLGYRQEFVVYVPKKKRNTLIHLVDFCVQISNTNLKGRFSFLFVWNYLIVMNWGTYFSIICYSDPSKSGNFE